MTASTHQQHRMQGFIKKHQAGNLSITDFCNKHKIHKWTFWYWRKKLASPGKGSSVRLKNVQQPKAFLPVVVGSIASKPLSEKIEIHYPSGMSITFPASFDLLRLSGFLENRSL